MKLIGLLTLFILFSTSCQLAPKKLEQDGRYRKIASLFDQAELLNAVDVKMEFDKIDTWLVRPGMGELSHVIIHSQNLLCHGKSVVRTDSVEATTFVVNENSIVACKLGTDSQEAARIEYSFKKKQISNITDDQFNAINQILHSVDNGNIKKVLKEFKSLELLNLYTEEISIKDLKKLAFAAGDYVHLELSPQPKKVDCPDGTCSFIADVFGLLDKKEEVKFKGMNLVKFPEISPYLLFCGPRYAAGKVFFKADEQMEFNKIIDENGFSCDVNSFLLNDEEIDFRVKLTWLSKDRIYKAFLGKESNFVNLKNEAITRELLLKIKSLKHLNKSRREDLLTKLQSKPLMKKSVQKTDTVILNKKISKGYLEFWWEPFRGICNETNLTCSDQKMVLTRARLIYKQTGKEFSKELDFSNLGLKQKLTEIENPSAVVTKICPNKVLKFLESHYKNSQEEMAWDDFKEFMKSFSAPKANNCHIPTHDNQNGKKIFQYRWLLASSPRVIEQDEIEKIVEDYNIIESPSNSVLDLMIDPLQSAGTFFKIYFKNLTNSKIPFKRSRIIEIVK